MAGIWEMRGDGVMAIGGERRDGEGGETGNGAEGTRVASSSLRISEDVAATLIGLALLVLILLGAIPKGILP